MIASDADDSRLSSRKTTNQLLAFGIVVVAAGFVSVGNLGPEAIRYVAEVFLVAVLVGALLLFLALLMRDDG